MKIEITVPAGLTGEASKAFNARVVEFLKALNTLHHASRGHGLRIIESASSEPEPKQDDPPTEQQERKNKSPVKIGGGP